MFKRKTQPDNEWKIKKWNIQNINMEETTNKISEEFKE